jgi:putative redox protein
LVQVPHGCSRHTIAARQHQRIQPAIAQREVVTAAHRIRNPSIPLLLRKDTTMKATVKWIDNAAFVGESESGHAFVMDGAVEGGGRNLGPRPMEVLLLGTGGCSAYDVVTILRKARQNVRDCAVEIDAERAEKEPRVFTRIHLHFVVTGSKVNPAHVKRAVELSADKYCSASIMLGKTAQITHDFKIIEDPAPAAPQ